MPILPPISVLVVDDHDLVRTSIVASLNSEPDITVIGEARNGAEAVDQAMALNPDVVVMDIVMPVMDGILAAEKIRSAEDPPKVLIVSNFEEDAYVRICMKEGASGYIMKDAVVSDLPSAIRVVHKGGHFFTPRIAQRIVGFYLQEVTSNITTDF